MVNKFCLLIIFLQAITNDCIQVISTRENEDSKESFFMIENLIVQDYAELTICFRFKGYQFYSSTFKNDHQTLISGSNFKFGIFNHKSCKDANDGCTQAVSTFLDENTETMIPWDIYKWNSFCIKSNEKNGIFVNNIRIGSFRGVVK